MLTFSVNKRIQHVYSRHMNIDSWYEMVGGYTPNSVRENNFYRAVFIIKGRILNHRVKIV